MFLLHVINCYWQSYIFSCKPCILDGFYCIFEQQNAWFIAKINANELHAKHYKNKHKQQNYFLKVTVYPFSECKNIIFNALHH